MVKTFVQGLVFIVVAGILALFVYWQADVVHRGGPLMVPIVMCSIFAMAITLERSVYFLRLPDTHAFLGQLRGLVLRQAWQEAEALCAQTAGPVARVVKSGVVAHALQPEEIDRVMTDAAHEELPHIESHHRWLSTIAQVSTLLGLLGTVVGMVLAFQVIQHKATSANPVSPGDLAGGIWQALITTVGGLVVAIPTVLAYGYLSNRSAEVQYQMERSAGIVANWRHLKDLK